MNNHSIIFPNEYGSTLFSVSKDKLTGEIYFQMDSCVTEMKVKEAKRLIELIQSAILDA